jgi:hypothetical protein
MNTTKTPRNINQARLLANINDRAQHITEDYRLSYNRKAGQWEVARKGDFYHRYTVTAATCTCKSMEHNGTCKHVLSLPSLIEAEIVRYTLLGFEKDLNRVLAFREEVEEAARWSDPAYVEEQAGRAEWMEFARMGLAAC